MTDTSSLPLFFREPVALSSELHADWRLRGGDLAFAAEAASVPIVIGEFVTTARDYPILFAEGSAAPVALLGLDQRNLFLNDGIWAADSYVPAYVRRYPFSSVESENGAGVLVLDAGSGRVARSNDEADAGEALFVDGKPTELLNRAIGFCEHFHADALATGAFSAALLERDLLVARTAEITLPNGERLRVDGFRVVDEERFRALSGETLEDWHRRGWLSLVHFHLASLARFEALLARRSVQPA